MQEGGCAGAAQACKPLRWLSSCTGSSPTTLTVPWTCVPRSCCCWRWQADAGLQDMMKCCSRPSAGPLHGPAFTQEYARSPCFRALHQPTYVDMIKPQAFANTLCKTADSSVCMACQHLLVRNSGSSILCVVWKLDELINRASLREALALRRVKVTQKALKNSYRPIFKGPAKRQGTIYTYYLNLLFKPSQVSMVTKFYSTLAGAWQLRLPLHSADTSLASLEHHVQFRSRCRVLMTVHLDDITGCRKC